MRTLVKSMMASAFIPLAVVVASGSAKAVLCGGPTTNTLADFVTATGVSNGVSCTVGDKTFSNFSYNPDGLNVPAANVGVSPDTLLGLPGLVFNGGWSNTTTANEDALITFTVAAPAASPITDFHLALDGVVGSVLDAATLSLPGGGFVASLSSSDDNLHTVSFAAVQTLVVADDLTIDGVVGTTVSSASSVHKGFSQVPGPIVGAGLPGLVAACAGLIGLARRRRRQIA